MGKYGNYKSMFLFSHTRLSFPKRKCPHPDPTYKEPFLWRVRSISAARRPREREAFGNETMAANCVRQTLRASSASAKTLWSSSPITFASKASALSTSLLSLHNSKWSCLSEGNFQIFASVLFTFWFNVVDIADNWDRDSHFLYIVHRHLKILCVSNVSFINTFELSEE